MPIGRKVNLFRNGGRQAVRIPRGLELPGDEAVLRKEGDRLILEPAHPATLLGLPETLSPINETIPDIDDAPPKMVDP